MKHALLISLALAACLFASGCGKKAIDPTKPGTVRLLYRVESGVNPDAMAKAVTKRLNPDGNRNVLVRPAGGDQIEVFLGDGEDHRRVAKLLEDSGGMDFHIAAGRDELGPEQLQKYQADLQSGVMAVDNGNLRWLELSDPKADYNVVAEYRGRKFILIWDTPDRTMKQAPGGWQFKSAKAGRDDWDSPMVSFQFDEAGGKEFGNLTGSNINKPLAAVVAGKVVSVARIMSKISQSGQTTGRFSDQEVADLAQRLQGGAMPGKLNLIEQTTVK